MNKHTKGPWRLSEEKFSTLYVEPFICAIFGTDKMAEANARLIAAAPELLEALEDMVALAADAMRAAQRDGCEYAIEAELSSARAAIAKAKGEG